MASSPPLPDDDRLLVAGSTLLGIGLGGFVDGILFHQILQWHNMLSSRVPPTSLVTMKYNMIFDGLFHALTWLITVAGVGLVFRAGMRRDFQRQARSFVGAAVLGWGLFNFFEGLIDHQALGLHHVHPGGHQGLCDAAFVASGIFFLLTGRWLLRSGRAQAQSTHAGGARSPA